jgi:hypothetical protein
MQHYYPRCLVKHFVDEEGKTYAYVGSSKKMIRTNPTKLFMKRDCYEADNGIDNQLEIKLSQYESQVGKIIDELLRLDENKVLNISDEEKWILFRYIYLQYIRTDSGRIKVIERFEARRQYSRRKNQMNVREIREKKSKINKFNGVMKDNNIDIYVNSFVLKDMFRNMHMHIEFSEVPFWTSDNPVIILDDWREILFPIHPYVCIVFQHTDTNCSEKLVVQMTSEKVNYINKCQLNTANYCVISAVPFTFEQQIGLYNHFTK